MTHVVRLNQTMQMKIRHMASTEVHQLEAILILANATGSGMRLR